MQIEIVGFGNGRAFRNLRAFSAAFATMLKLPKRATLLIIRDPATEHEGVANQLEAGVFLVRLGYTSSKTKISALVQTLAHEMVHVKQFAKGQLGFDVEGLPVWKGKGYSLDIPWEDRPWEIEAMKKESYLHQVACAKIAKKEI